MSEESWYASRDNKQIGPLAFEALQQMAQIQELGRDDLVWEIGTPGWIPAGQVPALCEAAGWGDLQLPAFPSAPRASFEDQYRPHLQNLRNRVGELDTTQNVLEALPHLRFVKRTLESLGRKVTVHQLDLADRLMKRAGSLAYMLAAVLYGVFFAVLSLRADSIQQLLATLLIIIPGASICHFVAVHFTELSEDMLRQTPTELSSRTLAMCIGILVGTIGVLMLIFASHDLFRKVNMVAAIMDLPIALALLYSAAACFNPGSLNLEVEARAHAAREAIGISMFLIKIPLRLVPVVFGLYALLAAGSAIFFCYQLPSGKEIDLRFAQALQIAPKALLVGLLPMAFYLAAVFAILLVDCLRASLDTSDGIQDMTEVMRQTKKASVDDVEAESSATQAAW